MMKVFLRWCMSGLHSGHHFQFDVDDTATMRYKKVVELNNEYFGNGWSQNLFRKVRICSGNGYRGDNEYVEK